jgi:putative PIN family toxin of toxin-antitoxin system
VRLVLDTNIVIAAYRNPFGASAALLVKAKSRRIVLVGTGSLALEYEEVCSRPEHANSQGRSQDDAEVFLNQLFEFIEPVTPWFLWRPQLRDADDEMVLEAAVNGRAEAIVTFNRRDFEPANKLFGLRILSPRECLGELR